jgi:hypothetical protein
MRAAAHSLTASAATAAAAAAPLSPLTLLAVQGWQRRQH